MSLPAKTDTKRFRVYIIIKGEQLCELDRDMMSTNWLRDGI